ncbi:hypothetical protein GGS23DRAFT_377789 [Durotheca rogersii]|uniref:uncharacterized protein n=1 Tax=Durotheca rogersii TaxID=419775 RepID=UPI00221F1041|nr:uncharacterized protein GGS23DRAFT_377789 [Durotheca rogersii]KAI5866267.1 hypothetical protein GGS23DRAFT_377789 [Durotheca rogersii]
MLRCTPLCLYVHPYVLLLPATSPLSNCLVPVESDLCELPLLTIHTVSLCNVPDLMAATRSLSPPCDDPTPRNQTRCGRVWNIPLAFDYWSSLRPVVAARSCATLIISNPWAFGP